MKNAITILLSILASVGAEAATYCHFTDGGGTFAVRTHHRQMRSSFRAAQALRTP